MEIGIYNDPVRIRKPELNRNKDMCISNWYGMDQKTLGYYNGNCYLQDQET